jgi:hypothetical protein
MTEDELWKIVEPAIWEVVNIVGQTSIAMHNSDIVEKVQRALPPGEYLDPDHIRRMVEGYWQTDLSDTEPPDG